MADFIGAWKASLTRALVVRKTPRPVLSGGFVSQVLQEVGLMPSKKDNYFLPMDFTSYWKVEDPEAKKKHYDLTEGKGSLALEKVQLVVFGIWVVTGGRVCSPLPLPLRVTNNWSLHLQHSARKPKQIAGTPT